MAMGARLDRFFVLTCAILISVIGAFGQNLPDPASPPRLVNDFAGLLTSEQQNALEQELEEFNLRTSIQIAVVTVSELDGYSVGDYAQRLHDKWGIGQKGKDNGILILVKPKTTSSKGEAFISVGYGLEGVIPDVIAGRIIDTQMLPEFLQGRYYAGISQAVIALTNLTEGEFSAGASDKRKQETESDWLVPLIFFAVFALFSFFSRGKGGKRGDRNNRGNGNGGSRRGVWIPPIILGGRGGGYGGFGGFGGGMSGGGGGGRSW